MEIKIQLPNPDDYQYDGGVAKFFTQMRISLKAAEKTYQEAVKDLPKENTDNVYLSFRHADNKVAEVISELMDSGEIDRQDQELFLEVCSI